ncbi:MAG: hypothetical protein IKZ44_00675 [Clostridia bacterium]|nr:hypothetical protein [Clostridia bacterium]
MVFERMPSDSISANRNASAIEQTANNINNPPSSETMPFRSAWTSFTLHYIAYGRKKEYQIAKTGDEKTRGSEFLRRTYGGAGR